MNAEGVLCRDRPANDVWDGRSGVTAWPIYERRRKVFCRHGICSGLELCISCSQHALHHTPSYLFPHLWCSKEHGLADARTPTPTLRTITSLGIFFYSRFSFHFIGHLLHPLPNLPTLCSVTGQRSCTHILAFGQLLALIVLGIGTFGIWHWVGCCNCVRFCVSL